MTEAPRPVEEWIKTTRRLTRVNVTEGYDANHNELVLASQGVVVNLPEPIAGTEVVVKTATANDVNIVAPPGGQIDDFGQQIASGAWQAAYFASNGEQWFLINRVGSSFTEGSRPQFELSNLTAPTSSDYNTEITVSVDVENIGDKGRDSIELKLDGEVVAEKTDLTLNNLETQTVTFNHTIDKPDGNYTLEASSPSSSVSQPFEVTIPNRLINVFNYEAPTEVNDGDVYTFSADIKNGGQPATNVPIQLISDEGTNDEMVLAETTLQSIDFLEEKSVSFDYEIDIASGTPNVGIYSPDASVSQSLQITYDTGSVYISNFSAPNSANGGEKITVTATATNFGEPVSNQPIRLKANGTVLKERTVSLDFKESADIRFEYTVELNDGTYDLGIHSYQSSKSREFVVNLLSFDAVVTEFNSPSEALYGDTITVTATVQNFADFSEDVPVKLVIDGGTSDERVIASETHSLYYLDEVDVSFNYTVEDFKDTISVGVFTPDDSESQELTITHSGSAVQVTNLSKNTNVKTGSEQRITADVTNIGDPEADIPIELRLNGEGLTDKVIGSTTKTLDRDQSKSVEFNYLVDEGPGDYTIGVYSPDDSETGNFNITYSDTNIEVSNLSAPEVAKGGDTISVTADLFNIGEPVAGANIELLLDGGTNSEISVTSKSVDVGYNSTTQVSFSPTVSVSDGDYSLGVFSPHDNQQQTFRVSDTNLQISNITAPSNADYQSTITVSATVENQGVSVTGSPITFSVDGTQEGSTAVDLGYKASQTVSFNYTISDQAEAVDVSISSGDDSESSTVDVNFDNSFVLVDNYDAQSQASFGEEVTASAELYNVGEAQNGIPIELRIDGGTLTDSVISTKNVDLNSGEKQTIEFTFQVDQDNGTYTLGIYSPDGSATQSFEVIYEETDLQVQNLSAPSSAERRSDITPSADITNFGAPDSDVTVGLVLDKTLKVLEQQTVANIGFEETVNVGFTHTLQYGIGDYQLGISTRHDIDEAAFTIIDSLLNTAGLTLNNPQTQDSVLFVGETVEASTDITNNGNLDGTGDTVELISDKGTADETVIASQTVSIAQGSTSTVSFSTPANVSAGTREVGIYTKDDGVSQQIEALEPNVQVSNLSVPDKVEDGTQYTISADLENIGAPVTGETVELISDPGTVDETVIDSAIKDFNYKETGSVSFTTTAGSTLEDVELGIFTTDDSQTKVITIVDEGPFYDTQITSSTSYTPAEYSVTIDSTEVQ